MRKRDGVALNYQKERVLGGNGNKENIGVNVYIKTIYEANVQIKKIKGFNM